MHRSNKEKYLDKDVNKVSKVLSKVLIMRGRQARQSFVEKPIKNKGNYATRGISHHNSTTSSSGG